MIKAQQISHSFGKFQALQDVSFEIAPGEIVGFLGQNGAGKTTLMRILTTYFAPTSGSAVVAGHDVTKEPHQVRRKIGYLSETPPLYPSLSVRDYLKFAAQLKGVAAKEQTKRIDHVLEECRLKEVVNRSIGVLSKGYKQRVGLAQAIIHDPEVLILDEPSSGLDPIQNYYLRQSIKGVEHKRTVILSTHILSEIEQIAKRVLIIKEGKIIADQSIDQLIGQAEGGRRVMLTLKCRREKVQSVFNVTKGIEVKSVVEEGGVCVFDIQLSPEIKEMDALIARLHEAEAKIINISQMKPSLDNVFRSLVGSAETV